MLTYQTHTLAPFYQHNSRILILGSLPSPKSREIGFYYSHPQNRFWMVLSALYHQPVDTLEQKQQLLTSQHIALWDVIASCEIEGASDASIKNPIMNDIQGLLDKTEIHSIYTTGRQAYQLYMKNIYPITHISATYLPSTSPANARMKLNDLIQIYQEALKDNA